MTKLNIAYQGFKLGVRVADQIALQLDVHNDKDVAVLHKLKNMAHLIEGMRNYHSFAVNGITYGI